MAADRDQPAGEFKRALGVAMKTIAGDPEMTVSFGNEQPQLTANKAKLPQVANDFTARDVAITRGLSDSFALRLSNHSDRVHARYRPQGKNARAVFEAVEQSRIEAVGANAMPGMAPWRVPATGRNAGTSFNFALGISDQPKRPGARA